MSDLDVQSRKALADLVRGAAPNLAALLDGERAAIALSALGRTLLNDAQAPVGDLVNAAHNTDLPTRMAIIAADQSCQMRLRENGVPLIELLRPDNVKVLVDGDREADKVAVDNTQNARARQIELHDQTNAVLAYATTGAFVTVLLVLIFFGSWIISPAKELVFTLLGVLGTGWANVIGYYFGTSASSQQKTQAMAAALLK